jgi:hypothetical protein
MVEALQEAVAAIAGPASGQPAGDCPVPRMKIAWGGERTAWPRIARAATARAPAKPIGFARAPAFPAAVHEIEEAANGRKVAFTLRLDLDRHARLHQVCATSRRSAQQLVTQALDAFLAAASGPQRERRALGAPLAIGGY